VIVVCAAILERLVEPKTFTGMGVALWWAVSTVGTVGYGDYTPHTPAGRVIGGATILLSMALIPTITSLVVAGLVTRVQRDRGNSEVAHYEDIARRLAAIEERLGQTPGAAPDDRS
jgi:voltage-gated potassium channel